MIATGRITVPERIWKVVVVLGQGENDVQRLRADTRIIAVDTPYLAGVGQVPHLGECY